MSDRDVERAWERAQRDWGAAIDAHVLAPPDHNFAQRLAALSESAAQIAAACRQMGDEYSWPPARKADSEPPYELRPNTGRRGPPALWRRFDRAVLDMRIATAGTDMLDVARAYEALSEAAAKLAEAVADEDRGQRQRRVARR